MKVLQLNSVCGFGSTGRITTDLFNILTNEGHDCVIAFGRGKVPSNINTIKIGTALDVYSHVLKTRIIDRHGFGSSCATNILLKEIDKYNPDIIHLHNIHGYYIDIKVLFNYLKRIDKPVIWTLHDCWSFTGHCSHFDYIGCQKWLTGCGNCPQYNHYPSSLFVDNSKHNYKKKQELFTSIKNLTIITPSNWLAQRVKQSFLGIYPVSVIKNGIDLDKFSSTNNNLRRKFNIEDKKIILGVSSQWGERKGLHYFLELSKILDNSFKIILVGVTEKIKKMIPNNIICVPKVDNIIELAKFYTAADVFVNPTLEEVLGLVNVESLACGTPVITFDSGGSPECISEETGIVIPKGNLDKLKQAILQFNPNNYKKTSCVERARKFFDRNDRYKDYISVYESALK